MDQQIYINYHLDRLAQGVTPAKRVRHQMMFCERSAKASTGATKYSATRSKYSGTLDTNSKHLRDFNQ